MALNQWVYRAKDPEHELLQRFMQENPEFTSTAQVVREGVLRLVHDGDKTKLFSAWTDLILSLNKVRDEFMSLLLREE